MSWISAILVYVIIWWMVLFCVLPWGNQAVEDPEVGHATSAPKNPRLKIKFAVTTVIAAVILAAVWWVMDTELITLRPK